MAYYPHTFYTPRGFAAPAQARPHSPPPHAFHRRHHSPLYHGFGGHGHGFGLGDDDHYNYNYRPAPASIDIDEEERLARAHLASIQRRREAERAAIEREASARLHAQQQREEAIARALEVQRQREVEAAIRREVERQQREHAIRVARQQREATAAAVAERRRAYEEHILARRRVIEQQHQQWRQQHQQRQLACAQHRSARRPDAERRDATREADADVKDGLEAMNALFSSLFGVRFNDDKAENATETESKTAPAAPTAPAADTKTADSAPSATADATTSKADKPAETNEAAFPEPINDILSAFLGLRVEPTDDTAASDNKVPAGLNEFLSQFGLVFEPDQPETTPDASDVPKKPEVTPAEPVSVADPPEATLPVQVSTPAAASSSKQPAAASSSAAGAPAPAADSDDTPITAFLNGMTDLPPFVRDILGNVELAFKEQMKAKEQHEEEVKGKGKGVAAGERAAKPVRPVSVATPAPTTAPTAAPAAAPAPAPASTVPTTSDSLAQLSSIAHDLHLVRESFTFPPTLSFAPAPAAGSDAQPAPALLFNKTNSGYHAQTHKLLQLLLAADGIASGGDRDVRRRRKALVREVEAEIEALEKRRDDVWEVVRAEREAGGEAAEKDKEVDSGNSSDTDSVVSGAESESELNGEERKSGNGNGSGSGRSSRAASVVDASEDRTADLAPDDEVEVTAAENVGETAHIEHASQHRTQQEPDPEVKGFDVAPPAHVEAASEAVADAEQKSFADVVKEAPEGKEKDDVKDKDEVKEDGYELV